MRLLHFGRRYLSNIPPHLFCVFRRVKDHRNVLVCFSCGQHREGCQTTWGIARSWLWLRLWLLALVLGMYVCMYIYIYKERKRERYIYIYNGVICWLWLWLWPLAPGSWLLAPPPALFCSSCSFLLFVLLLLPFFFISLSFVLLFHVSWCYSCCYCYCSCSRH